jgi:hypothetical protein
LAESPAAALICAAPNLGCSKLDWAQFLGVRAHIRQHVVALLPAALLAIILPIDRWKQIRASVDGPFEYGNPTLLDRRQ